MKNNKDEDWENLIRQLKSRIFPLLNSITQFLALTRHGVTSQEISIGEKRLKDFVKFHEIVSMLRYYNRESTEKHAVRARSAEERAEESFLEKIGSLPLAESIVASFEEPHYFVNNKGKLVKSNKSTKDPLFKQLKKELLKQRSEGIESPELKFSKEIQKQYDKDTKKILGTKNRVVYQNTKIPEEKSFEPSTTTFNKQIILAGVIIIILMILAGYFFG